MVLTDWKSQVIKFEIKGEPITLVGDPSLVHSQISLKAMKRTLKKQGYGFWVECNCVEREIMSKQENEENIIADHPEFVAPILQKYSRVLKFQRGCLRQETENTLLL